MGKENFINSMCPNSEKVHRILLYGVLASGVFVVYGSLLPIDFQPRSLHDIRLAILEANASVVSVSLTD